jgi:hypothetical protein
MKWWERLIVVLALFLLMAIGVLIVVVFPVH